MTITQATPEAILKASNLIQEGELVAFPTETVYGLGANALDGQAVAKIFEAKNRPSFNPLIVHVASAKQAGQYVEMNDWARAVAHAFWPGPISLILPKKKEGGISDLVSAGLETLAVRVPSHPVAQQLLQSCALPIAAPSANASGEPSATTPMHVAESLGQRAPFILAGGASQVGLESTVLDLTGEKPVIVRPGAVTPEDLKEIIGNVVIDTGNPDKPTSPGQLIKHYAPSIPVHLHAVDIEPGEALLSFGPVKFMGIKGGGHVKDLPGTQVFHLSEKGDLHEAAANLFAGLRALDRPEHKSIAVMDIPNQGVGIAINDRLERAARGR